MRLCCRTVSDMIQGRYSPALMLVFVVTLLPSIGSAVTVDRVLAVVNNEVITLSEYLWFLKRAGLDLREDRVDDRLLKRLIEEKLILQEAVRKGVTALDSEIDRSLADFLSANTMTLQDLEQRLKEEKVGLKEYRQLLRESIITLKFIDREVNAKLIISEREIEDYYRDNRTLFLKSPERITVKAIILHLSPNPTPTEITDMKIKSLRIYSEIQRGEPFEKMVGIYADESLKQRDGFFGEFEKGALVPALDHRLTAMKPGGVSEPVWTKDGVYILKLIDRKAAVYAPLAEVRKAVRDALYEGKRDTAFQEWVQRLWNQASVKIMQP